MGVVLPVSDLAHNRVQGIYSDQLVMHYHLLLVYLLGALLDCTAYTQQLPPSPPPFTRPGIERETGGGECVWLEMWWLALLLFWFTSLDGGGVSSGSPDAGVHLQSAHCLSWVELRWRSRLNPTVYSRGCWEGGRERCGNHFCTELACINTSLSSDTEGSENSCKTKQRMHTNVTDFISPSALYHRPISARPTRPPLRSPALSEQNLARILLTSLFEQ